MAEPKGTSNRPTYTSDFIKSDTDRAVFMGSPQMEAMFSALLALSAEVWTGRRRQKILESVLMKHANISPEVVETYVPTAAENAQWKAERDAFVRTIYEPFLRPADIPFDSSLHPDPATDPARRKG